MDKVLIIGGCGFIGSRLYQFLLRQGMEVVSVDLEWFGKYAPLTNYQQDYKTLTPEFLAQFKTVILLAGHSSVKMCVGNLTGCFNNNVVNFLGLLNKLKKEQRFIYASSSSIYGGIGDELQAVEESSPKYRALNYYDLSKYEIDNYAKIYDKVEYYGLRFGTVGGFSLNFRDDIMINAMYRSSTLEHVIRISNPKIHRPLLGLNDLCLAVLTIIKNGEFSKRGIYNLASFNSTVEAIGKEVADVLSVPLVTSEDKPNIYDFTISTQAFCSNFNFAFRDTILSILSEIQRGQAHVTFTNRNTPITYG